MFLREQAQQSVSSMSDSHSSFKGFLIHVKPSVVLIGRIKHLYRLIRLFSFCILDYRFACLGHISRSTCSAMPLRGRDAEKDCKSSYHAHAHAMLTPLENAHHGIVSLLYVCFVSSLPPLPPTPHVLPLIDKSRQHAIVANALDAPAAHRCLRVPPEPFAIRP